MPRALLILALLVSGTGCSATRPLLGTIVVTPPGLSFRQLPCEDAWQGTAVAVSYPLESLTPAPCAPSPVRPVEQVAFFEEDESLAPLSPSEPVPSVTTVDPVPPDDVPGPVPLVDVPVPVPPTIVSLEDATSPQSVNLPIPCVAPDSFGITPLVQTASTSTLPTPSNGVDSPPPSESPWKPTTSIALASPDQTSPSIRCHQDEATLPEVRPVMPVKSLSSSAPLPSDVPELLTEIREQRQLIEALQRELTRERSADDEAIEELEAAVENLLVQTKTTPSELPTTLRK